MKLRARSKRKATEEYLLFREQTHRTKRTKVSEAQHEAGYSLRSKPAKLQQQKLWFTQAQREKKKNPQRAAMPCPLTAAPGVVPSMRQFRSRRLSLQQKPVPLSHSRSQARRQLVVSARRSLRIDALRMDAQLLQHKKESLATRRSSRRLGLPHGIPSNLDACLKSKRIRTTSSPGRKLRASVAKQDLQQGKLQELDQPCVMPREMQSHQESEAEVAVEQGTDGKQQVQELGTSLQENTSVSVTCDERIPVVGPTAAPATSKAQPSPSPFSEMEAAKDTTATSTSQKCFSDNLPAKAQVTATGGQSAQGAHMSALLNIKAGVQALNRALQSSRSLHSSGERITAGVSYVVSSKLALPHVTIRPALPEAAAGPTVESLVNVLRDQAAIALVMPAHNEGVIKEYLRHPERRLGMAAQNSTPFRLLQGIAELKTFLADRTFTCLHYRLGEDCQLVPCTLAAAFPAQEGTRPPPQQPSASLTQPSAAPPPSEPASEQAGTTSRDRSRWTVADSNVQIGLLVRKGIGGTSPARAAARRLYREGVLGRILGDSESHSQLAGYMPPASNSPVQIQQGDQPASAGRGPGSCDSGNALAVAAITETRDAEADELLETTSDIGQEAAEGQLEAEAVSVHSAEQVVPASSEPRVRLYTQSCRLEMYCAQQTWTALSREQQAALIGAIQGLEKHLSRMFARWNHDALIAYAQKLAAGIDLWQAQVQQAAALAAVVRQAAVSLPSSHPAPTAATQPAVGAQLHAGGLQPALPPLLPQVASCPEVAPGVQVQAGVPMPHPSPAPKMAATPAAGAQVNASAQQWQSPALAAAPSTPSVKEAQPRIGSPGAGLVIGIPCLQPAPRPAQPQAATSWPTPAAALGFLQQLLRIAPLQQALAREQPPPAAGAAVSTSAVGLNGGNAGHSNAVRQGHGGCGTSGLLVGQQVPSVQAQQSSRSRPQPPEGAGHNMEAGALKVDGALRTEVQCTLAPCTPSAAPQSPVCSPVSSHAALQPATPPARPPTAALLAAKMAGPTGCMVGPYAAAVPGEGPHFPAAQTVHASTAGMSVPGDAASALVLASAASSALAALGISSSAGPVPWPLYLIGTRDSFTYHLHAESNQVQFNGRSCVKTEYFFQSDHIPNNYHEVVDRRQQCACRRADIPQDANSCEKAVMVKVVPPVTGTSEVLQEVPVESTPAGAAQQEAAAGPACCGTEGDRALPDEAHQPARLPASAESTEACEADNGAPKPASVPPNCPQVSPATLLPAGICTYANFYTPEELRCMEASADGVHAKAREGRLPQTCFHETRGRGGGLKRTKFFFGARYLWTAEQAADPASRQAGGVRLDVPHAPTWMQAFAEKPLVETGLVQKGFFDAWALNMYHDGSEGIQSHFDDGTRFARPIFSVRLFSDSRLSFGTQLYGYTNGAFTVDMPRGCITVMEAGGYAVEGVKHCVRPADLAGKSAALIMRHINPACMEQARDLFDAQTLQMLRGWSMKDAPIPPVPCWAASRELPEALIARECWSVLDRCIQRLESPVWLPGSGPESQVAHVLDAIISKVERQNYLEQLANGHIRAATHSQAGSIGVKRKVPLARMVFNNTKRLKWIEEQLSSSLTAQASTAASPAGMPAPAPITTSPSSAALQASQQGCSTTAAAPQLLPVAGQPCQTSTVSAGVQPGRAGSQSRDAEQLLRGLLLAASEQDVSNRIRGMALSHQQRLLQYLQGALRRLPTAPSQLDSFGDAYAPPQTAAKPGASDESALSLTGPPSVLPQLAAQASMTAAKVAAQLKGHPGAVCAACERPLSAGQHVWACLGQCCQIFHSACAAPMGAMKCAQCMSDRRMCFHCKAPGPPGELVKCSMGRCGHFYHRTCAAACPLTKWGSSSGSFRCPAHYCARCGLSGDSVAMLQCRRCPVAYHARCRHQLCRVLSKKYVVCPRHAA